MAVRYAVRGEVSEREERLDGDVLLALDGVLRPLGPADGSAGIANPPPAELSVNLSWLLGREGAEAIADGDLAIAGPDWELTALLRDGTVEHDSDTGGALVEATFSVDPPESGGAPPVRPPPGTLVRLAVEVGVEAWSGTVEITDDA